MLSLQAKAIPLFGATIILLVTSIIVWNRNSDYNSTISSLHFSTSQTQTVTFRDRPEYRDLTKSGDEKWKSILPVHNGLVSRPKQDGAGFEMAGVTMFHQLQCLQVLRSTIRELMAEEVTRKHFQSHSNDANDGTRASKTVGSEHQDIFGIRKRGEPLIQDDHWTQCLDYLMQGILCSADDTLEQAHVREDGKLVIDGSGTSHQCRNADRMWEMVANQQNAAAKTKDSVEDLKT